MCVCVYVGLGSTVVTGSQTTSNNAETEYRLVKLTDKVRKNNRCMHIVFIMCVCSVYAIALDCNKSCYSYCVSH